MNAVGLARTEAAEGTEGVALKTSLHGRDSARAISLRKHTIFIAIQGDSTRRVLVLRTQRPPRHTAFSIFNFSLSILMYNFAK